MKKFQSTTTETILNNKLGSQHRADKNLIRKYMLLVFTALFFLLSSCGRNVGSGCGNWSADNSVKRNNLLNQQVMVHKYNKSFEQKHSR